MMWAVLDNAFILVVIFLAGMAIADVIERFFR